MIVAIDGPAGVGKSSAGNTCAIRLKYGFLSSGLFYRIVTVELLNRCGANIKNVLQESKVLASRLEKIDINKIYRKNYYQAHENSRLFTQKIDIETAIISKQGVVRDHVNKALRKYAMQYDNIIIEGRDMTHTVFPDADVKIYLDAIVSVRASRRAQQIGYANTSNIQENIKIRDKIDKKTLIGSFKSTSSVQLIDTTYLNLFEVCDKIIACIMRVQNEYS